MPGYVSCTSACGQCGRLFSYHPHLVPSLNGVPFCLDCVEAANPTRIKNRLEPIVPATGAYEACPEEELYGKT
jgi:hypothetical protein